jgi:trigger factor
MQKTIKPLPKSQVEITFELTAEELKPYFDRAIEKISSQKPIEGFRPGKAPYDILKQHYGEMKIYGEAADLAIPEKLFEAIKEDGFDVIEQPQVDIVKLAPANPFIFKTTLTLLPKIIELGNFKKIKIKRKEIKTEESQIDNLLREVQNMRAKEVAEDKAVEKNDKVEVDYDISIDHVALETGLARKYPIIIGAGHFLPGFEEQVTGMKKGETKEFKLTFPEKHYDKKLAGKEADFKVTVNAVYRRELPEINDEFAKSLGGFEKLEDVKKQLRTNLEEEAKAKEDQRIEIEMLEKIVDASKFEDIPSGLIDSEAHKMVHELEENVEAQGIKFDDYLMSIKKNHDQLLLDFAPQALKRVKTALIVKEIAKKENIEVEPKEIDAEVEKTVAQYPDNDDIKKQIRSEAYRHYLENVLTNRKVIDFLKSIIVE